MGKKNSSHERIRGACPASSRSGARSRGGQPGNKNAVRHGFYSRQESADVGWQAPPESGYDTLQPEIAALGELIRRLSARLDTPDPDLKDPDAPLKAILSASHRLGVLHKFHYRLQDSTWERMSFIQDSIAYLQARDTHPARLLTLRNLEKLRSELFPDTYRPFEEFLTGEHLQAYQDLLEWQNLLNDES